MVIKGPALGYFMVNLPMAIATILQAIMIKATLGLQDRVLGALVAAKIK